MFYGGRMKNKYLLFTVFFSLISNLSLNAKPYGKSYWKLKTSKDCEPYYQKRIAKMSNFPMFSKYEGRSYEFSGSAFGLNRMIKGTLYSPTFFVAQEKIKGVNCVIKIERSTTWYCDNHKKPQHTASDGNEMREKTEKNGCEGWHTK